MEDNDVCRSQIRKGMLEYCLLLILKNRRSYTSDILTEMRNAGLVVVEGTLYTLLNRLRKEGKLDYEWEESPKGPPRKYYIISEKGITMLHLLEEAWNEMESAIEFLRKERQ